jgi:hypothetical protein
MGRECQGEMPVGKEGQKRISITLGFSLVVKSRFSLICLDKVLKLLQKQKTVHSTILAFLFL